MGLVEEIKTAGGVTYLTVKLGEDAAGALLHDKAEGDVVAVGIGTPEEPDDATAWIQAALKKISTRTGKSTNILKHELMAKAGSPLKLSDQSVYIVTCDRKWLQTARALYTREIESDVIIGELIKSVRDHRGDELRDLLTHLNAMLADAGVPEQERASDRLIDFYIQQGGDDT